MRFIDSFISHAIRTPQESTVQGKITILQDAGLSECIVGSRDSSGIKAVERREETGTEMTSVLQSASCDGQQHSASVCVSTRLKLSLKHSPCFRRERACMTICVVGQFGFNSLTWE